MLSVAVVWVENAMKTVVGVIAALVTLGMAALGLFTAQQLSSPPDHVAGPAFRDQATSARATQSSVSTTASVSPAPLVGSAPDAATSSAPPLVASEPVPQSNADSRLMGVGTTVSPEASVARSNIAPCEKPDTMGVSRVVEIDTTGGPEFGLQHLRGYDFLRDKEVVLTFDDGPHPVNTIAVLYALQDECLKATFFEIGENASWHPEITKELIDAEMTVGTHTWSHKDLARKPYTTDLERAAQEIEMGASAVRMAAAGAPVAPFFRFPELQHAARSLEYLAQRNIAVFSTDIDSRDFSMHRPEQVIKSVTDQLDRRGKGIILMHDSHRNTAEALPELLRQLKTASYKVVHMVPKVQLTTIPKYDEMFGHRNKLSSDTRQENSVVRTIGQ
jgi:peptidoglycan/xylan/chitin deacetylase (PgdA/CDA1 family)